MIELLQYLAVISSGLFGVLLARSKGMDLVGICGVAFIVAFGGGTLRDVLLDRQPERYSRDEDWIPQALVGLEYGFNYTDDDAMYLGAEYFFNDAGYGDVDLYLGRHGKPARRTWQATINGRR